MLVGDVDVRSAEELARFVRVVDEFVLLTRLPLRVVVEAGAVGRVALTREGAADGQRNARPRPHFFERLTQVQRFTHGAYRRTIHRSLHIFRRRELPYG